MLAFHVSTRGFIIKMADIVLEDRDMTLPLLIQAGALIKVKNGRNLMYIHPKKFFLITSVKLKGTYHETYHMIAKVDPILLVKFGGVW